MSNKENFLKCVNELGVKVEENTIVRISDYSTACHFFTMLKENNVQMGMDMSSGTCSGDVEVTGKQPKYLQFIEKDNGGDDLIKFKEMIILITFDKDADFAPEIFIEADVATEWLAQYSDTGYPYVYEGSYLLLEDICSQRLIYDREKIEEYLDEEEEMYYTQNYYEPKTKRIVMNTKRELVAYLNVQGHYDRHRGSTILYHSRKSNCDALIRAFEKKYKIVTVDANF